MAKVERGAISAGGRQNARAVTRGQRAEARVEARPRRKDSDGVQFEGQTDHLWAYDHKPILGPDNSVVGREEGLFIEFLGGRTKTYFPDRYAADKKYVEKMDAWIASGDRTVEKYGIQRVEPDAVQLPFPIAKWDTTSGKRLKDVLEMLLGEDDAKNEAAIAQCVLYETENGEREDVLKMLEGLLGEADVEDALAGEFTV